MKKILLCTLSLLLAVSLSGCGSDEEVKKDASIKKVGIHHIEIVVKDYGIIKAELNGDVAPITVTNFIDLANKGFYNNLTFHRIIDGFMIQGGDPNGDGTGGSDKNIKGEFESNNISNDIKHTRGVLSMARAQDPDSGSSQFFIMHQDAPSLDGDYAAFGKVSEGMDVVDAIVSKAVVIDNNGSVEKANQPIIESIKVID
ncbi:MAG: peptidylprolyl isomerase [Erysipelotrichaceae bacterium]